MKIAVTSVMVDDQDKALKFYTEVLGFVKKTDIPMGKFKWLTVVSPEAPDGVGAQLPIEGHGTARKRPFERAPAALRVPREAGRTAGCGKTARL